MEQTEEFLRERERKATEEWCKQLPRCANFSTLDGQSLLCSAHCDTGYCALHATEAKWVDAVMADGNGNPR